LADTEKQSQHWPHQVIPLGRTGATSRQLDWLAAFPRYIVEPMSMVKIVLTVGAVGYLVAVHYLAWIGGLFMVTRSIVEARNARRNPDWKKE
jgi:hypothetical protein